MKQREFVFVTTLIIMIGMLFVCLPAQAEYHSIKNGTEPTIVMRINDSITGDHYGVGMSGPFILSHLFDFEEWKNMIGIVTLNEQIMPPLDAPDGLGLFLDVNNNDVFVGGYAHINADNAVDFMQPVIMDSPDDQPRGITFVQKKEWKANANHEFFAAFTGINDNGDIVGIALGLVPDMLGQVKWVIDDIDPTGGANLTTDFIVDENNDLYFATDAQYLYGIDAGGTQKWAYPLEGMDWWGYLSLGMNSNALYLVNSHYLVSIDKRYGSENWSYDFGESIGLTGNAAIGTDDGINDTIYVTSGNSIFKFSSAGVLLSETATPDMIPNGRWPVCVDNPTGTDDIVYFTSATALYALTASGVLQTLYTAPLIGSPAVGSDGTIYATTADLLYAINPDGSQKWAPVGFTNIESDAPVLDKNENIYIIADNGLYSIDPSGSHNWGPFTRTDCDIEDKMPEIGPDGTIYLESHPDLFAINPDGTLKWTTICGLFNDNFAISPVDGTIYSQRFAWSPLGEYIIYALKNTADVMHNYPAMIAGISCNISALDDDVLDADEYEVFTGGGNAFTMPVQIDNSGHIIGFTSDVRVPAGHYEYYTDTDGNLLLDDSDNPIPGGDINSIDNPKYFKFDGLYKVINSPNGVYTKINLLQHDDLEADQAAGKVDVYGTFPYALTDSGKIMGCYTHIVPDNGVSDAVTTLEDMLPWIGDPDPVPVDLTAMTYFQLNSLSDTPQPQSHAYPGAEQTITGDITLSGAASGIYGTTTDIFNDATSFIWIPEATCTELSDGAIDLVGQSLGDDEILVPVRIQNFPDGSLHPMVDALGFEVTYNTAQLDFVAFEPDDLLSGFDMVGSSEPESGLVRIGAYTMKKEIPAGETGLLGNIRFNVLTTDTGAVSVGIQELVADIKGWPATGACLSHASGDLNGDGEVAPDDALCAFQKAQGDCPTDCGPCETIICDVNADGDCSSLDVLCIFNKYLGLPSCLD
jgi:hypothetical protein